MRRCVFLDRDGVVNVKMPEGQYVNSWDEFHFIPETIDWIRLFKALDLLVIVVTNQRGVARGITPPEKLEEIHRQMASQLAELGAAIDDIFCCPHEEGTCHCRKPRPGLVLAAQRKWNLDLPRSLLIGDSPSDRQLAEACGIPFIGVCSGKILWPAQAG